MLQTNPDNLNPQTKITENVETRRFHSILGYEERVNDVIYCPPQSKTNAVDTVVYFGGDVQDYAENMEKQRDGKKYVQWNLENTALLLHKKFPTSHIVVIKPSRMEYLTFSCYKNFVNCNDFGIPEHCPDYSAIDHLEQILKNVEKRVNSSEEEAAHSQEEPTSERRESCRDLILIGFSKGCVVLNQLSTELHHRAVATDQSERVCCFRERIREMYWLDGGHSGGRNTWITSKPILKTLAELQEVTMHVHVTPYQVEDQRRPWIRKEERIFTDTLGRYGATLNRFLHFSEEGVERNAESTVSTADTTIDISMHFNVLNVFKPDVITNL